MLSEKVTIITGASSGIGKALATRLAAEGSTLILAARRMDRLESLAELLRLQGHIAHPVECDVTVRLQAERLVQETVRRYGRVDILVNNAGRGHFASVEETTDETIYSMFAVNAFSLWYTTRPALRHMRKQGSGHIINIASIAGKVGFPYNSAYVAAKHACVGFTHALRQELAETGIHATVVCPAGVLTDWAASTEGGPILPLFAGAGPAIKKISKERGIDPPPIEGVKEADAVAAQIVESIYHPVAELYTHRGSKEFVVLSAQDREAAERRQLPAVLAEQEAYHRIKTYNADDS